jgi:hypothetical protein
MGNKKRYCSDGAQVGGFPKIVILSLSMLALLVIIFSAIRIKADRVRKNEDKAADEKQFMSDAMLSILPPGISKVSRIFVIPGGGPGLNSDAG